MSNKNKGGKKVPFIEFIPGKRTIVSHEALGDYNQSQKLREILYKKSQEKLSEICSEVIKGETMYVQTEVKMNLKGKQYVNDYILHAQLEERIEKITGDREKTKQILDIVDIIVEGYGQCSDQVNQKRMKQMQAIQSTVLKSMGFDADKIEKDQKEAMEKLDKSVEANSQSKAV